MATVEVASCHGMAWCMHHGKVARGRGVQHEGLNQARDHLAQWCREWWGFTINGHRILFLFDHAHNVFGKMAA